MYRPASDQANLYENPNLFPGARLNPVDRWIKLAGLIEWDRLEEKYKAGFNKEKSGRPAKNLRMALGAHIIKERYHLSDLETVKMIKENPYLQFFIGMTEFTYKAPFGVSTMTWFRKRLEPVMTRGDIIALAQRLPK
ncbi:MAG: transposase [Bacillota bacterium]|nr:transposase [Bacillota bacterium]